ncbi:hypothetical protein PIB30_089134 [Stylosanthes scabra]|uniref:Transmembrane protein n=1 Tax=Stylosanthes scabra TaxID=79078 RepID=A0ABU6XTS3_9FABA|nr:hypothetical protein [Stylosanthes scabra]
MADKKNPHIGVIVKMSNGGIKTNCSLAVSVLCDYNGVKATELKHPSACAVVVSVHGGGLGWFVTLLVVVVCLFAAYLLAGAAYRFFFLGIRGIDRLGIILTSSSRPLKLRVVSGHSEFGPELPIFVVVMFKVIPNLDFWVSLPRRIQIWFTSLVRRFKGPSEGYRSSYSPVNF